MAQDQEFAKKYMFGLAMVLKKGLHIHIIHDVERPMKDMMLGLENWIPLYMTGQISPYYLKGIQNKVYSHLHYTSGQAAMTGDCISGHHDTAHYYLTSRKEEVEICRKNTKYLLKKAHPLMEIYREEKRAALFDFLEKDSHEEGQRRRILAAPPLFVIPQEVLKQILAENGISRQECAGILKAHAREQRRIESILTHSQVIDELSQVTKAEYEKYPAVLPVAECFLEKDILLTYQEYRTCVVGSHGIRRCPQKLSVFPYKGQRLSQYSDYLQDGKMVYGFQKQNTLHPLCDPPSKASICTGKYDTPNP